MVLFTYMYWAPYFGRFDPENGGGGLESASHLTSPWDSKDNSMVFPKRPLSYIVIYNQYFQGTIFLMVFDFQGYSC